MSDRLEQLRPGELTPLAPRPDEFEHAWARGRQRRVVRAGVAAAATIAVLAGAGITGVTLTSTGSTSQKQDILNNPTPTPSSITSSNVPPPVTLHLPAQGIAVTDRTGTTLYSVAGQRIARINGAQWAAGDAVHVALRDQWGRELVLRGGRVTFGLPSASPEQAISGCYETSSTRQSRVEVCNHGVPSQAPQQIRMVSGTGTRVLTGSATLRSSDGKYDGYWEYALSSPDGKWVLGQWSGECESPSAYFVNTVTSVRTQIGTGEAFGLGWPTANLALVYLPNGSCGGSYLTPGVYLVRPPGSVVRRLVKLDGSQMALTWGMARPTPMHPVAIDEVQAFLNSWVKDGWTHASNNYLVPDERQTPNISPPPNLTLRTGRVVSYSLYRWNDVDNYTILVTLDLNFAAPDAVAWSQGRNERFVTFGDVTDDAGNSRTLMSFATGP